MILSAKDLKDAVKTGQAMGETIKEASRHSPSFICSYDIDQGFYRDTAGKKPYFRMKNQGDFTVPLVKLAVILTAAAAAATLCCTVKKIRRHCRNTCRKKKN